MCDPMQLVERYEELNAQIEKRIYDLTEQYDPSLTVRQWLSLFYSDRQLLGWDVERQNLLKLIPLGYLPESRGRFD